MVHFKPEGCDFDLPFFQRTSHSKICSVSVNTELEMNREKILTKAPSIGLKRHKCLKIITDHNYDRSVLKIHATGDDDILLR